MDTFLQIIASDTLRNFLLLLIFIVTAEAGDKIVKTIRHTANMELKDIREELVKLNLHR
jgi:hypothetical protein|tara:strand:- start:23 stop:199 length:177 start_codon:yes stop_codon:yes gene_type:complete